MEEKHLEDDEFHENEEEEPVEEDKPKGVTKQIEEKLLAGETEEELLAQNFNSGSIRNVASLLEKAGKRRRPPKQDKAKLQIFAKGSPPEALVDSMEVPVGLDGSFEHGMKFGMLAIISGVRIAQELSQIGVQQARPLVDMAKDMRSGEALAARTAATEAASAAANQVQQNMSPYLMKIAEQGKAPISANPMTDMMVRMIEPVMQNTMKKIMPGMDNSPPAGWQRKTEE